MHYCFRLRLEIAGFARIASSRDEFVLEDVEGRSVVLTCPEAHDSGDPTPVVVLGRGYESSEAAEVAGHEWTAVLQRAFAHLNIGADRGTRVSGESFPGATGSGRSMREGWFNDTPGLIVFPEEPWPTFALFTSHGSIGRDPRSLVSAVEDVRRLGIPLSAVEQTAYDLYSSAFSATTFDARFVVLMMALETLLEPEERAADVVSHVDNLIEITTKAQLPSDQRASLLGSLRYMRQESIGQAGRRLALRLGERRYMELEAPRVFTKCYDLRSSLVHGSHPRPDRVLIESYLPHLERLVADLLAGKLLEEGSATEE